jgi:hypothetical protein
MIFHSPVDKMFIKISIYNDRYCTMVVVWWFMVFNATFNNISVIS